MTNTYKILTWVSALLVVVALIAVGNINQIVKDRETDGQQFKGLTHNIQEDFSEGITVDGNVVIAGDGAITSRTSTTTFSTGCYTANGLDTCEVAGSFEDASTTHKAILNPFRATSTASVGGLQVTVGASTSRDFFISTSTSQYLGTLGLGCTYSSGAISCDGQLIDELTLATNTVASNKSKSDGAKGEITTYGSTASINYSGFGSSGTSAPIMLGPDDWLIIFSTTTELFGTCAATTSASAAVPKDSCSDGVTNSGNKFDGNFMIEFKKW